MAHKYLIFIHSVLLFFNHFQFTKTRIQKMAQKMFIEAIVGRKEGRALMSIASPDEIAGIIQEAQTNSLSEFENGLMDHAYGLTSGTAYPLAEVARLLNFNTQEQNITLVHRRALKKLRKAFRSSTQLRALIAQKSESIEILRQTMQKEERKGLLSFFPLTRSA
jgi:hypothetical protein